MFQLRVLVDGVSVMADGGGVLYLKPIDTREDEIRLNIHAETIEAWKERVGQLTTLSVGLSWGLGKGLDIPVPADVG